MKFKNMFFVIILMAIIIIFGVSYFNKDITETPTQEEPLQFSNDRTTFINMRVNGFKPYTNDGTNNFNVVSLRTDIDNIIEFKAFDGQIFVNDVEVDKTQPYKLSINNINKDNNIKVTFLSSNGEKSECFIRTLPNKFPNYSAEGESPYEGEYYLTTYADVYGQYVFRLNNKGEVTFYKEVTSMAFNFTKVTVEEGTRYCYLEENLNDISYEKVGYKPCELKVLDENYNLINTIRAKEHGIISENAPLENHDYIYLGDNHYLVSAYVEYEANNIPKEVYSGEDPVRVLAAVIQEVKDGEVIFQWQSIDHPELYVESEEHNEFNTKEKPIYDYCHLNSFVIDPKDNNLICSFRNLDEILKIDRTTGEILWTLGGKGDDFNINNLTESFSRQHYANVIEDGKILFFDNGNERNSSSAVKISYDEENKTITSFERYKPISRFAPAMGSAQLISRDNDVILINYGNITDKEPLFYEIDFKNNKELFKFSFEGNLSSYRVQKFK